MSGSLIINARYRQRWYQRLVADASTTMMWGAWLHLWVPVVSSGFVTHAAARSHPTLTLTNVLASGSVAETIGRCIVALAGVSGTLLMWKRLPATRVRTPELQSVRELARHFEVPEHVILAGRRASVCVVHHDDSGRIVWVECRTAACVADEVAA